MSELLAGRRRWLALIVLSLGQFMIALDSSIVNVALPAIQTSLHFAQANLTWVVNAYLITYGSFQLTAGRFGDLIGRKRVFLTGVIVFTISSLLCGLAQDQWLLIAARFAQGLGGAISSSVIVAIMINEFVRPDERARAMSIYMFVIVAGSSLGLLAGGVLAQALNWHWIFFVNLPIGVLTASLGWALIEDNDGIGLAGGVDVLGSVLVTSAMVLAVYTIVTASDAGWRSLHTIGFGAAASVLLASFLALEARLENPMMPFRILRLRSLTTASAVRAIFATGLFSSFFFGALYLGQVHHFGAITIGLAFLPVALGIGLSSLGITARLMARFGPKRVLIGGLFTAALGLALLSRAGEQASYFPGMFIALLLLGVGGGNSFLPLLTIAMSEVPGRDSGLASALSNVWMQTGAALGLAALGTIVSGHTRALFAEGYSELSALTSGYRLAFALAAAAVGVGLLAALMVLRSPRPVHAVPAIEQSRPVDEALEVNIA